jgi:hypothetical protein
MTEKAQRSQCTQRNNAFSIQPLEESPMYGSTRHAAFSRNTATV